MINSDQLIEQLIIVNMGTAPDELKVSFREALYALRQLVKAEMNFALHEDQNQVFTALSDHFKPH